MTTEQGPFRVWLHTWVVTLKYGSVLTRAGRDLRRRAREPFDRDDYVEVKRPSAEGSSNLEVDRG